jgi:hypothetical protein
MRGCDPKKVLFALAIRGGLKASQLRETIFAYPTRGSDVKYMV